MGYNGMPDGIGFKDEEMDWARVKKGIIICTCMEGVVRINSFRSCYFFIPVFLPGCCAELNAIISAFRRFAADLSSCTCYTTHSPCEDCNKLIAQSGIKNVVFALLYHEGNDLYSHLGQCKDFSIK